MKLNFEEKKNTQKTPSCLKVNTMYAVTMMTPSNGNIFRVAGHLWGESTGDRWIPLTKASDAELWWFLWSAPEQTLEQTI